MHRADISHVSSDGSSARKAGDELVVAKAQRQVQTFFDELKNGTSNYRTVASLDAQIAQEYRGRCILELLQNAHDALAHADADDVRRISFVLSTDPEPVLSVGNSGRPFRREDFDGICQLAQSPKDPNESVGNKGLGFRSVLEVSSCPEIWSVAPTGCGTSFVFRFDPDVADHVATVAREIERHGIGARSPFDPDRPLVDWSPEQLNSYREQVSDAGIDAVCEAKMFLSAYLFPLPIEGPPPPDVDEFLRGGHATVVRLRLNGGRAGTHGEAVESVTDQLSKLDARSTLFLHDLGTLVIDINGDRRILGRTIEPAIGIADRSRTRTLSRTNPHAYTDADDNRAVGVATLAPRSLGRPLPPGPLRNGVAWSCGVDERRAAGTLPGAAQGRRIPDPVPSASGPQIAATAVERRGADAPGVAGTVPGVAGRLAGIACRIRDRGVARAGLRSGSVGTGGCRAAQGLRA